MPHLKKHKQASTQKSFSSDVNASAGFDGKQACQAAYPIRPKQGTQAEVFSSEALPSWLIHNLQKTLAEVR
jgi:hypothetical protein